MRNEKKDEVITDQREIFARERDAMAALQRADTALAEAAGLTLDISAAALLEEIRGVLDVVDAMVWQRKNAAWKEIQKENKEDEND